ncbi:MAG: thioredoxin domain-containing protein [Anaerolineaceae bacterium]|nr:thioredoxin domain-containing protein [Anaerolineaceae bacterium]
MFCIIAFVVLGILGIFSATNRQLAKEALDCVLRRVTLRPCNTGFDEKMKARILGSVITRSETAAMVLNKNFEIFSWIFFILMLGSSIWAVRGVYLFYVTGSCNGLNSSSLCVFDPKGNNNQISGVSQQCTAKATTEKDVTLKGIDLTGFPAIHQDSPDTVVFLGCYHCDYSRKAYPLVRELVKKFKTNFIFLHFPVKESNDYFSKLGYCVNQQNPDKLWEMNDIFFNTDKATLDTDAFIQSTLTQLNLDVKAINQCVAAPQTEEIVKKQMAEIVKTHFYGTPTVFINDTTLIGPKPYRVYAITLKGLFFWLK